MVRVQIAYFILYGCLASMLPFLAAFFVLKGRAKRNGAAFSNSHTALVVLFALYIFAVFWVTGAGTLFDLMRYGLRTQGDKINLLPFSREISVTGYLLNAVLFMPLGFLGVSAAASQVFFSYIGFDAASTAGNEAKDPKRDLPRAIMASLLIVTVLYLAVALADMGVGVHVLVKEFE